jgi:hypothetical protein
MFEVSALGTLALTCLEIDESLRRVERSEHSVLGYAGIIWLVSFLLVFHPLLIKFTSSNLCCMSEGAMMKH